MKREHLVYCKDRSECPVGHSCLGGTCVEDITPPPPSTTKGTKKPKGKK